MARNNVPPKYELTSVWFTDAEKSHYQQWTDSTKIAVIDLLIFFQDHGLKVSISEDNTAGTSLVSVTFKPLGKRKKGYVFMYRHSDLEKCLSIARYHVEEVMDLGANLVSEETDTAW